MVVLGRENAWIGLSIRSHFAGLAAVTVHAVDPDSVELRDQPLAHNNDRSILDIGKVRNESDDTSPLFPLGNSSFRDTKKSDIKIVQVKLLDLPLSNESFLVRLNQTEFFGWTDTRECVVRWVAQNYNNRLLALYLFGSVALLLQLRETDYMLLRASRRLPASKRICR